MTKDDDNDKPFPFLPGAKKDDKKHEKKQHGHELETPSTEKGHTRKDSINQTFDEVSEAEDPHRDVTPVDRALDDDRSGVIVTKVRDYEDGNVAKPNELPGNEEVGLEERVQGRNDRGNAPGRRNNQGRNDKSRG